MVNGAAAPGLVSRAPGDPGRPALPRPDLQLIADMIEPGARVLDVGCGDGLLLDHLIRAKRVVGRGVELSQAGVNACVARGLSVVQGDADTDLRHYPAQAFDYAILSQTLQAMRDPKTVLSDLARIGRHAIVSLPNFGFWKLRWHFLWSGRMPRSGPLDHEWYDTPNIHLCTITDFVALADRIGVAIERSETLDSSGAAMPRPHRGRLTNLLAEQAVFLLRASAG